MGYVSQSKILSIETKCREALASSKAPVVILLYKPRFRDEVVCKIDGVSNNRYKMRGVVNRE